MLLSELIIVHKNIYLSLRTSYMDIFVCVTKISNNNLHNFVPLNVISVDFVQRVLECYTKTHSQPNVLLYVYK